MSNELKTRKDRGWALAQRLLRLVFVFLLSHVNISYSCGLSVFCLAFSLFVSPPTVSWFIPPPTVSFVFPAVVNLLVFHLLFFFLSLSLGFTY